MFPVLSSVDQGEQVHVSPALAADTAERGEMRARLAHGMFLLAALTCAGLAARELLHGGPWHVPAWGAGACAAIAWWARTRGGPSKGLTLLFLCLLVGLVDAAAFRLGGPTASSLCLSFIPGFVAVLLVGPAWGWLVCGLMLTSLGVLFVSAPQLRAYDLLRFVDEVGMTVWATALAHALERSFGVYEATISRSRAALLALRDQRQAMARAIYDQLEPLATELELSCASASAPAFDRASCLACLQRMVDQLKQAKELARVEPGARAEREGNDRLIRRDTMRLWLRLGAAFMAFIALRNYLAGVVFAPSLGSLAFCILFDLWLSRTGSLAHLELTALAVGLAASGPMILHVSSYGGGADAPALVVTPGTVLFTALLSQGPAAWAIVAVNCGILAWVGLGRPLTGFESRLLGDLVAAFLATMLMLRGVFKLRTRYGQAILEQTAGMAEALRQHRRLAGTLFHDVSNQLQTLTFYVEEGDDAELATLQSLTKRVKGLIDLSKEFLVGSTPTSPLALEAFALDEAVRSLKEAFGPRLRAKGTRFEPAQGVELKVLAQPELLIESVLGNLLSNAIKFSPPGSLISFRAEPDGAEVRMTVRDEGPGLPPQVTHSFEEDAALPSTPGTAGESGQGYGLQLAREHASRMGGRLRLRNLAEGGTEATVWLPRA